jgi:FtsZ-interacting cell division protein ZipA
MDGLYAIMNVVGPLLLGAVLLYVILANRKKRSAADLAQTERGTRALHEELDREDKAREHKASSHQSNSASSQVNHGAAHNEPSSEKISPPNISTEYQPEGSARHPRDTLDREPERDPLSQGSIPSNYDPAASKRAGEAPTAPDAEASRVAKPGRE